MKKGGAASPSDFKTNPYYKPLELNEKLLQKLSYFNTLQKWRLHCLYGFIIVAFLVFIFLQFISSADAQLKPRVWQSDPQQRFLPSEKP